MHRFRKLASGLGVGLMGIVMILVTVGSLAGAASIILGRGVSVPHLVILDTVEFLILGGGLLLAMVIHEGGHALLAQWLGVGVESFELKRMMVVTRFDQDGILSASPWTRMRVYSGGVLANFVVAMIGGLALFVWSPSSVGMFFSQTEFAVSAEMILAAVVTTNLLVGVVNSLPFKWFDGGKVVREGFESYFNSAAKVEVEAGLRLD